MTKFSKFVTANIEEYQINYITEGTGIFEITMGYTHRYRITPFQGDRYGSLLAVGITIRIDILKNTTQPCRGGIY